MNILYRFAIILALLPSVVSAQLIYSFSDDGDAEEDNPAENSNVAFSGTLSFDYSDPTVILGTLTVFNEMEYDFDGSGLTSADYSKITEIILRKPQDDSGEYLSPSGSDGSTPADSSDFSVSITDLPVYGDSNSGSDWAYSPEDPEIFQTGNYGIDGIKTNKNFPKENYVGFYSNAGGNSGLATGDSIEFSFWFAPSVFGFGDTPYPLDTTQTSEGESLDIFVRFQSVGEDGELSNKLATGVAGYTIIPESSSVGMISIMGMAGFLFWRRFRKNKQNSSEL